MKTTPWTRLRSAWRAITRARRHEQAMHDEMRFHLDMEAERLARERGVEPAEARRLAHVAFGGVEAYKEHARDVRGFRWFDALSLDARLGVRMLVRYRGLTVVGGFAMAVTIAIGASFFEAATQMLAPALPFPGGERVVALQLATDTPGSSERRIAADFIEWRRQLRSVEQLSAFRIARHNLSQIRQEAEAEIVEVAEITSSAFTIAGVAPRLGRYLVPADERPGAAPVLLIGHDAWQTRFAGDPDIVGRVVDLGGTPHMVVGVMPQGFRFPINQQYWTPLLLEAAPLERGRGPALYVLGRLRDGTTLEAAQAEFAATALAATRSAVPNGRLRPVVLPYTWEHVGLTDPFRLWLLRLASLLAGALTCVVAVNLAILIYARTVARQGEMAVRTALGASRPRILTQLFVEALALTLPGAALGLALARVALERLRSAAESYDMSVFWMDYSLSSATVVYALALAVLAAVVMGVLPGVKATGGPVSVSLRQFDRRSGVRLGPAWTLLIVGQVAAAVAILPLAVYLTWQVVRMGTARPDFPAESYAVAVVALADEGTPVEPPRVRGRLSDLTARLEAEPGVRGVTFASGVPGFAPGRLLRFVDGVPGVTHAATNLGVDVLEVALNLFDVYDAPVREGRRFGPADLGRANVVIVNRAFARELLAPGAALGARFRYVAPYERPGTSPDIAYEVIGVVEDFPGFPPEPGSEGQPTVYHPAAPGDVHPLTLTVRFHGGIPDGFLNRFRTLGASADGGLQIREAVPLTFFYGQLRNVWRSLAWSVGLVTLSVLLLSAAGIYALMSFTVAQRSREIAIRAALGASPRHLVLSVFDRAARQLGLGLLAGSLLSAGVFTNTSFTAGEAATLTLLVAALMAAIGLGAAIGPARRGLRIDGSEALKADS